MTEQGTAQSRLASPDVCLTDVNIPPIIEEEEVVEEEEEMWGGGGRDERQSALVRSCQTNKYVKTNVCVDTTVDDEVMVRSVTSQRDTPLIASHTDSTWHVHLSPLFKDDVIWLKTCWGQEIVHHGVVVLGRHYKARIYWVQVPDVLTLSVGSLEQDAITHTCLKIHIVTSRGESLRMKACR